MLQPRSWLVRENVPSPAVWTNREQDRARVLSPWACRMANSPHEQPRRANRSNVFPGRGLRLAEPPRFRAAAQRVGRTISLARTLDGVAHAACALQSADRIEETHLCNEG